MIDAIAARYGTDPWTVLQWPPERLGVAMVCLDARSEKVSTRKDVQATVAL